MIDVTIVSLYLVLVFSIGIFVGRRTASFEDFAVAGRQYGPLVIFTTLSASFIGGGFSIGNAEKVFLFGIANIFGLWGFSLKEFLVAKYLAPQIGNFEGAVSIGDIMAPNFGKIGRIISGIMALALCSGIVGAQVGAIGVIFNVFFGFSPTVGILLGCGIVILYTSVGGMRAVVLTDIVQFVVLAIGIPLVLIYGIIYIGGVDALIASVPRERFAIPGPSFTWLSLLSLFLAFFFGEALVPPYVQRLLIGKNAKAASQGTLLSSIFSIPFFVITGLIGLVALAIDPDMPARLAMPEVIITVMPPVLQGLVIAGIISVVMSSADSFLNSAAVALVNDIAQPIVGWQLTKRTKLNFARATTISIGVASVIFALSIESVLDILIFAYTYWAPVMLVPLWATIIGIQRNRATFLVSAIAGITSTIIWNLSVAQSLKIEGFVFGVLINLIVFWLAPKVSLAIGNK
ncbi:MAG: sodium:solute symporter family protein [Cyanobacteria bacterium P01_H01_bin.15]